MNIKGYNVSELPVVCSDFEDAYTAVYDLYDGYSKKISLSAIEKYIYDKFISFKNISSMAFADKDEFAVSGHLHSKYTSAYYIPENIEQQESVFAIIHLYNGKISNDISVHVPVIDNTLNYVYPVDVGTLKFMANPGIEPKNINAKDFDGWTFPGQTITCAEDEFKEACLVYAGNANATQFTVPAISDFVKICVNQLEQNACVHNNFCNKYPAHLHDSNMNVSFEIAYDKEDNKNWRIYTSETKKPGLADYSATSIRNDKELQQAATAKYNEMYVRNDTKQPDPPYVHAGSYFETYNYIDNNNKIKQHKSSDISGWLDLTATSDCQLDFKGVQCVNENEETGVETKPRHNLVPILVYIGLRND